MKTKKKKPKKITFETHELIPLESNIQVGDIVLSSNSEPIKELCGLALWLLKQKEIKEYLGLVKKGKLFNGSVG